MDSSYMIGQNSIFFFFNYLYKSVLLIEQSSMSENLDCVPVLNHIEVKPFLPNICLKEGKWCENNISFLAPAMTHSRVLLCFSCFPGVFLSPVYI